MTITRSFIPQTDCSAWDEALRGVPHPFTHRWEYCQAMTISSGLQTFLYVAEQGSNKALCPLSVREKEKGCPDLVSPYGFGGFATSGSVSGMAASWKDYARAQGFVAGYIMQHPVFLAESMALKGDVEEKRKVYILDLAHPLDVIQQRMGQTHRYELRRWSESGVRLVMVKEHVKSVFLGLYNDMLARISAAPVYHFRDESLDMLMDLPHVFVVGAEEHGEIQAAAIFLHTQWAGEYFLGAYTADGRKHSRALIWGAVEELKKRGVVTLNLGGGVQEGDSLDDFKRRFGGRPMQSRVLKQVYDPEKYSYLCRKYCSAESAASGYFPQYWIK